MLCPKCYGKIDKNYNICKHCGFKIKELEGASNKQAKKIKRTIYKDDILYSTYIPGDVSKKKLLLFCIFLGLFGAHDFYVGKFWIGLCKCVTMSITLTISIILWATNTVTENIFQIIFEFVTIFQGFNVILWVNDIFRISFERYKIPIYKDEFSKK